MDKTKTKNNSRNQTKIDKSTNINLYKNDKKQRIDWFNNQALIQSAYVNLIIKLKRCPTVLEISEEVNLSITTINAHIAKMKFEPLQSPMRSLTPDVIASIYTAARKGQSASQKLWMQLMEGWSESTNMNITGSIEERIHNMGEEERLKRITELKQKMK